MIPAFRRQRQEDICELEASMVYIESSSSARATLRKTCPKKKKKKPGLRLFCKK